jgi:hypothetical protein
VLFEGCGFSRRESSKAADLQRRQVCASQQEAKLMPNLFTDPLSAVTAKDIGEFLCLTCPENQRPQEGTQIDYKTDLPQDLGDTIAAFANTYGGLIFIGVKSDKAKQNIPVAMPGAKIGGDVRARLTDRIISTVYPRPDFEVHSAPMGAAGESVVLIRVRQGTFPPYEYSQGATIRIPVRVQDTNRQATVREIEDLFKRRETSNRSPEELVTNYLDSDRFFCAVEGIPDPFIHKVVIVPRVALQLRLDSKLEKAFRALIRSCFQTSREFTGVQSPGPYLQAEYLKSPSHRIWRIWPSAALGFAANHSRLRGPEPIGNLAADLLFSCRLAARLFEDHGYFGGSVLADVLASPTHKFAALFPPPGGLGDYDEVPGIYFEGRISPGQPERATWTEEMDWQSLRDPGETTASAMLDLVRHITGARIDFETLLEGVARLADDSYLEATW